MGRLIALVRPRPSSQGPRRLDLRDPLTRAQRLKLIVNQARFLGPAAARRPNLASQILAAATAALPDQWLAQCGYAPVLAETFTDPEAHAGTVTKPQAGNRWAQPSALSATAATSSPGTTT